VPEINFGRDFTKYGLIVVDPEEDINHLTLLLKDQYPTVEEQKNLISLTGAELMKVHCKLTFTEIKELKRWPFDESKPFDKSVFKRKDSFKQVALDELNKPIDIKIPSYIVTEETWQANHLIFLNKRGQLLEFPDDMPTDEKMGITKLVKATLVLLLFDIKLEILPKASPHRGVV
jgi:hypothetical protein